MMKKSLIAAVALVALAGCSTTKVYEPVDNVDPLLSTVNFTVDNLASQLKPLKVTHPLVVASAQNNDDLAKVCPQGRLIAEMVSSRLTQHGFPVSEVKLAKDMRVSAEGETILSRDLKKLATEAEADTVVAATWSTFGKEVKVGAHGGNRLMGASTYVTLKAVRIADGRVLGSQTFASPVAWTCN